MCQKLKLYYSMLPSAQCVPLCLIKKIFIFPTENPFVSSFSFPDVCDGLILFSEVQCNVSCDFMERFTVRFVVNLIVKFIVSSC